MRLYASRLKKQGTVINILGVENAARLVDAVVM